MSKLELALVICLEIANSLSAASILLTALVIILCLSAGFKILVTSNNLNGLIFRMRCKHKYTVHTKNDFPAELLRPVSNF